MIGGMFHGKVFGVGLNKTGTKSLTEACRLLGFTTMHFTAPAWPPHLTDEVAARNVREGRDPLAGMPEVAAHDAFFDVRFVERYFPELDAHHPDSRFIYHHRRLDSWLDSRERHVRRNIAAAEAGQPRSSWLTIDRDGWAEEWRAQRERVRSHFRGREEVLLEIDVVAGDGWEKLAPFLDRLVPAMPFPSVSRTPNVWGRARRRLTRQLALRGRAGHRR
jgi:hypothetical protein